MSNDETDDPAKGSEPASVRRRPRRPKAQATVERILDVTAHLLDEVGLGVTTNHIAEAAGVNVATLYQYFPNKEAVLLALLHRQLEWRLDFVARTLRGLHRNPDWRDQVRRLIDGMFQRRDSQPGIKSVRLAMRASPELSGEHHAASRQVAEVVADELCLAADLDREEAVALSLCVIEALVAMTDLRDSDLVPDRLTVEREAFALAAGIFARYLDPPEASAG